MPVTHITYNRQLPHGSQLGNAVQSLERGIEELNAIIGSMAMMINGDGSSSTHFPYMTAKYGFSTDADAQAAYNELNSVMAKLNSNTSQTNVKAALDQVFSKFR